MARKAKAKWTRAKGGRRAGSDPLGRRIAHRAARRPWYRRGRVAYPALAGGLFILGIVFGTSLGFWLAPGSSVPEAHLPINSSAQQSVGAELPEGSPLPVDGFRSEQALRQYEEQLAAQPPALRPDPDAAPANAAQPDVAQSDASLPGTAPAPATPQMRDGGSVSEPETAVPQLAARPAPSVPPAALPDRGATPEAWRRYAVPVPPSDGRPRIAIVIDDLGIDQPRSRRALSLPSPLTLAFLPYGYNLDEMVAAARANGHEILVHVPMAPFDLAVDPGPNALQRELGPAEILRRLDWDLDRFGGYVGINNHMGSRFTADSESMALVIGELRRRGLIFMDSVTTRETKGFGLAARMGVPYAVRDVFLDHAIAPDAIRAQLARAEAIAREQGHAIAIAHPHDATLDALAEWIAEAEARGFQLVPVSALVRTGPPVQG